MLAIRQGGLLSFISTSLLCLFVLKTTDVKGYAWWCKINRTLFLPEESAGSFQATMDEYPFIRFYKTAPTNDIIFYGHHHGTDLNDIDIDWFDSSWENRIHFSGQINGPQMDIKIEMSNISMSDNGTYRLRADEDLCLILFVMQIRPEPAEEIEENQPVYIYSHPYASLITRPPIKATMVWLIDGQTVNQTANFIQQDGLIWIPQVHRGFDGKNVTYRALQDNGQVSEVNYTFNVMYGPSQSLTLIPELTQYYLTSGDVMPDITCMTECKPPCSVSWGEYSNDRMLHLGTVYPNDTGQYICTATRTGLQAVVIAVNIYVAEEQPWLIQISPLKNVYILSVGEIMPDISCTINCSPPCELSWGPHSSDGNLSLGKVSMETTGAYICIATRKGSMRRVEKSITVHVQDNTSFIVAIACLAVVQILTTFGVGLCAFLAYRRSRQTLCQSCFSDTGANLRAEDNNGLENYKDLNTDSSHAQELYETTRSDSGLDTYENIRLSSSQPPGNPMSNTQT